MTKTLSEAAMQVLSDYEHLEIGGVTIPCLYYNNKRQKIRAGLRVSIGKGSPKDILDEIEILALKSKIDLQHMSEDDIRAFLQSQHIGVDCSALAYYTLRAEVKSRANTSLRKTLKYPLAKSFIRKVLSGFRSVENTNVRTLAHEMNSTPITVSEVLPGDMIVLLEGGTEGNTYHVMIVHAVDYQDDAASTLHYTHSYEWSTDGKHHHGVRTGQITITNSTKPLMSQTWTEKEKVGEENETYRRAKQAKRVELRRLHILNETTKKN